MLAVNVREKNLNKMPYEATPSGEKKLGNLLVWKLHVAHKIVRTKLIRKNNTSKDCLKCFGRKM